MTITRQLLVGARRTITPVVRRLPPRYDERFRQCARLALKAGRRLGVPADLGPSSPTGGQPSAPTVVSMGPATAAPALLSARPGRGRGATVVLMYHRIADDAHDPFRLAVSPSRFTEQMAVLSKRAEVVALRDVTRRRPGPRVAVTFDDGYADNALVALDILRDQGVPATVFVTSEYLGSPSSLWPLRLEELFRRGHPISERFALDTGGRPLAVDLSPGTDRRRAMHSTHEELRSRPPREIALAMADLERQFGDVVPDPNRRMLDADELRVLSASGIVTVGAHTRRHPWLSRLTEDQQREEIAGGRQDLETLIGTTVDLFAYPFGTPSSFDGRTVRTVRQAGFSLACSTFPDPIVAGTSRFRLPRRQVLDWEAGAFSAQLDRWLAA
jgi:peptidoglycan/xylan/chitin deacetylase (PgdA/CDA1 family)